MTIKHRWTIWLVLVILASSLQFSFALDETSLPGEFKLTILHTNDLHGHLLPFDYGACKNVGGVARRAGLIQKIKEESDCPVLVMEAGDVFNRGPLGQEYFGEPDFAVMNALGCDVMTIGNNEFKGDRGFAGQQALRARLQQAEFPIVCANIIEKGSGNPLVAPYTILDVQGLKIGIIGLLAPRVAEYPEAEGLVISDPIETAREIVPKLAKQVDVVIALTHIGYNLDLQLAAELPEIDVIIGGDSHTWTFRPTSGKKGSRINPLIVHAGEWGAYLSRLDLVFSPTEDNNYDVRHFRHQLIPLDNKTPELSAINQVLEPYLKPLITPLGTLDQPIPAQQMAKWTAEAIRSVTGADIGAHSESGIESGLPGGQVTRLDVLKVYPYYNFVVTVELTGKQLLDFIAEVKPAVAGLGQIHPDEMYILAAEDYLVDSWEEGKQIKIKNTYGRVSEVVMNYLKSVKSSKVEKQE